MAKAQIHPTSIVSEQASLADDVVVGPYCVVKGRVSLGAGSKLISHVVVGTDESEIEIGKNNVFSPFSGIGTPPQDLSHSNETTKLIMGDNNNVRECATINVGTAKGGGVTKIGNNNLIMAYSHIAHDCHVGSRVVIANSCQFAGHVFVEDDVKIGGVCCFNQFVRLGRHCYIAGDSTVNKDIAPFTIAQGKYATMRATNQIGMERGGIEKSEVENIKKAIRALIMAKITKDEVIERIEKECKMTDNIQHLLNFIRSSDRGLAR